MTTVFISGLGLIGSSIARVIKQENANNRIIGFDPNDDNAEFLVNSKIIERTGDFAKGAKQADFIILAGPVSIITNQIEQLGNLSLKQNVVVTDVGSTKQSIMETAGKRFAKRIAFFGGHPMAGSHLVGSRAGSVDLFDDAIYFLISGSQTSQQLREFKQLLSPAQVKWTEIDAKTHDHLVGQISHIPHIIATTLVNTAVDELANSSVGLEAAAGGFKSTTRIAAADPTMWTAILLNNADEIGSELKQYQANLTKIQNAIQNNDAQTINEFFTRAQAIRQSLDGKEI